MTHRIGRFEILDLIGEGAMGTVYRAHDPTIGRVVAVKTVRFDGNASPAKRDQVMREARSAGALSHPNIVTIFDAGIEQSSAYITMEFVDGKSLATHIHASAPLHPGAILNWLDQIASALDYAHEQGVIHRDIKPSNILLARDGRIKLADFGIAKLATTITVDKGVIVGTPGYMAPEQMQGSAVDYRCDIFSLGVVVYELIAGKCPFEGDSLVSTMYKVVAAPPPPIQQFVAELPEVFNKVLLKALEKHPAARYSSCREFVEAVRVAALTTPATQLHAAGSGRDASERTTAYCGQCGTALDLGVRFCSRCGASTTPRPPASAWHDESAMSFETRADGYVLDRTAPLDGIADPLLSGVPRPSLSPSGPGPADDARPPRSVGPLSDRPTFVETPPEAHSANQSTANASSAGAFALSGGSAPAVEPARPPRPRRRAVIVLLSTMAALLLLALGGGAFWAGKLYFGRVQQARQDPAPPAAPVEPARPADVSPEPSALPAVPRSETSEPRVDSSSSSMVEVIAAETTDVADPDFALGSEDGKYSRIPPGGSLAVALASGLVLKDDGTHAPDVRVVGDPSSNGPYTILARLADGTFSRIDRVKRYGSHDLGHHHIAAADAFKIVNTGTADLLVDCLQTLRPPLPR